MVRDNVDWLAAEYGRDSRGATAALELEKADVLLAKTTAALDEASTALSRAKSAGKLSDTEARVRISDAKAAARELRGLATLCLSQSAKLRELTDLLPVQRKHISSVGVDLDTLAATGDAIAENFDTVAAAVQRWLDHSKSLALELESATVFKYSPDQPRDDHGRFGEGDGGDSSSSESDGIDPDGLDSNGEPATEAGMAFTIQALVNEQEDVAPPTDVRTFHDSGLMTNNAGLVVEYGNRSEYHLTIVPSNVMGHTSEREVESELADALQGNVAFDDMNLRRAETFDDRGVMSSNTGLVLQTADKSEFQITVVQSQSASRGSGKSRKYSEDQPRDDHGRFGSGGGSDVDHRVLHDKVGQEWEALAHRNDEMGVIARATIASDKELIAAAPSGWRIGRERRDEKNVYAQKEGLQVLHHRYTSDGKTVFAIVNVDPSSTPQYGRGPTGSGIISQHDTATEAFSSAEKLLNSTGKNAV